MTADPDLPVLRLGLHDCIVELTLHIRVDLHAIEPGPPIPRVTCIAFDVELDHVACRKNELEASLASRPG